MEGICPKCGTKYYGWALNNPLEQRCEICGADLDVFDDSEHVEEKQSPFDYLKYEIPTDTTKEGNAEN